MYYMRDSFLEQVYKRMKEQENIFVLSADVGAPVLDLIRRDFSDRFINTGIAEQNMINVAAGLAMEGFEVYAYSIASFFLRCADQIRNSLLLSDQMKRMNVNLLATGKGISYETAGPAHFCMEDLPTFDIFPGIGIFVPSDSQMAGKMADEIALKEGVKYFGFEGKKTPHIYDEDYKFNLSDGFIERGKGENICIISQGSILSLALSLKEKLNSIDINPGVIDLFTSCKSIDLEKISKIISKYKKLVVLDEGYRERGFLVNVVKKIAARVSKEVEVYSFGFDDKYVFDVGPREWHYQNCGLTVENIISRLSKN